jgi:hypothetical protein
MYSDGARVHVGDAEGLHHAGRLAVHAGRQVVHLLGAVVVHRGAADDRVDHVAVVERVAQAAQHHHAHARAEHRALPAVIERVAVPVGREHLALLVDVAAVLRQLDGDAARQRHVALAARAGSAPPGAWPRATWSTPSAR